MMNLEHIADSHANLIGQRLAIFRKHIGLSQQDIADQLGTTQNLIYRLEKGLNTSILMAMQVAHYYRQYHKLNLEWLINPEPTDSEFAPMIVNDELNLRKKIGLSDRKKLAILEKFMREFSALEERD